MNRNIEDQLAQEGFFVSTTVGWSMFPMLRNRRDRVVIHPTRGERLKKYDLPLYRRPDGKYILHRVIGVRDGYYLIRGDNTYRKERVPEEWILGRVEDFYRNGKHKNAQSRGHRLYARLWNWLFPLRFVIYYLFMFAARVKRKLFGPRRQDQTEETK